NEGASRSAGLLQDAGALSMSNRRTPSTNSVHTGWSGKLLTRSTHQRSSTTAATGKYGSPVRRPDGRASYSGNDIAVVFASPSIRGQVIVTDSAAGRLSPHRAAA